MSKLQHIPVELRELAQWVCAREDKKPVNPHTGQLASVVDSSTWGTFEQAAVCVDYDGITHVGFVLTVSDRYTIIDLDDKPSKPLSPAQREVHSRILAAFDSYTERSASGRGYHIIVCGAVSAAIKRDAVEVYTQGRYMICTGEVVKDRPIVDCQAQLDVLVAEMQPRGPQQSTALVEHPPVATDAEVLARAERAKNGAKFRALWANTWQPTGPDSSQSANDFALLNELCFYSPSNEQVRRLFCKSVPGQREKARRNLDRSIAKIRAGEPPHVEIALVPPQMRGGSPRAAKASPPASGQVPPLAATQAVELWATPLPQPIPTPFSPLDDLLGGGFRGQNVVAGPTGRGKSGAALQCAIGAAHLMPVLYASTELSTRQALARIAAQVIKQPWRRLFEGDAATGQTVAGALAPLNLRVVMVDSVTRLLEVLDRIAQHEGRPPFLVLDYLQGLARNPDGDRRLAMGALSEAITTWSRTTDGASLVVSSISRANYLGTDAKNAADFVNAAKESGDVEYDASSVLFLDVPAPPLGGTSEGRLHVAKSRFGTVGTVGVIFDGPTGVFSYNPQGSLTEEQAAVLAAIRVGATSQGAIASRCCLRKATVGSVIKALLARQLIGTNPLRTLDVQIDKVALAGRFADQFDARSPGTVPGSFPSVPDTLFSREKLVPDPGTNPVGGRLVPPL